MARKSVVQIFDDLTNEEITGEHKTVEFSVGKKSYRLDLSESSHDKFFDDIKKWTDAATEVPLRERARGSRGASSANDASRKKLISEIRKWGKEQGLNVSTRGRISQELVDLYNSEHNTNHSV